MRGVLPDINCQGHFLNLEVLTFEDLDLAADISDRLLWQTCQHYDVVLITANRNANDPDSLETTIQNLNTPQSLPVVTLANVERIRRDRQYAEQIADQLIDILFDINNLLGTGRLFVP